MACMEEQDFEKPIEDLTRRIEELSGIGTQRGREPEIKKLQNRLQRLREDIYAKLTPWQAPDSRTPAPGNAWFRSSV